jgi:glycogen debranching enzyme
LITGLQTLWVQPAIAEGVLNFLGATQASETDPTVEAKPGPILHASILIDLHRLPELVCGFPRRQGQSPTRYPVACSPQAWASGAVFLMVEAMLGLHFEAASPHIRLRHPRLPAYLGWLEVKGLHDGDAEIDRVVRRHGSDVSVTVERRRGELDVSVIH